MLFAPIDLGKYTSYMGMRLNKKYILKSGVGFMAVLAVTIGILAIVNPTSVLRSGDGIADDPGTGICTLLSKQSIASAIGDKAHVYNPQLAGPVTLPGGDATDVCVFPFQKNATAENSYIIEDSFNFEVYTHASEQTKQAYISTYAPDTKTIDGLGERATYAPIIFSDGAIHHELVIYSGLKHYTLRINQPKGAVAFSEESAQKALEAIARTLTNI